MLFLWVSLLSQAQTLDKKDYGMFNRLCVGASVSTKGIGLDVATCITPYFNLRFGLNFMPDISLSNKYVMFDSYPEEDYGKASASLKRTSAELLLDVGFGGSFHFTGGLEFGSAEILKIDGHPGVWWGGESVDYLGDYVIIENYRLPLDSHKNLRATMKTSSVRPYLGIGFSRTIPKKHLGFGVELGAHFLGKVKMLDYNGNEVEKTDVDEEYEDEDEDYSAMSYLIKMCRGGIYPVIKFRLSGRIF